MRSALVPLILQHGCRIVVLGCLTATGEVRGILNFIEVTYKIMSGSSSVEVG